VSEWRVSGMIATVVTIEPAEVLPDGGLTERAGTSGWSRTFAAWWSGSGALPTTRAGAELCMLVAFLGLRATDVVQLIVAAPEGLHRSTSAVLDGALLGLYFVESAVIAVVVIRARRYYSARWALVDTSCALIVLLAQPVFTTTADRVGTWTAWGYAISVGAALGAGIGFPKRWQTAVSAAGLAAAYLATSLPGMNSTLTATVASNTVAYFGFALFGRALAGYLRRLGSDADRARTAAVAAASQAEFDRHRLLLHDQATVLRLVSEPDVDPVLAGLLRQQAASGANKIRAFLGHGAGSDRERDPDGDLEAILRAVVNDFTDLPIDVSAELAGGVKLSPIVAGAIEQALNALLYNIRVHAAARNVLLHADADRPTGQWELSVRDDGRGFDPTTTRHGFGLGVQVEQGLRAVGVDVTIESVPGEGTGVVMRGPIAWGDS
jgi:signal transduction histidine kinase